MKKVLLIANARYTIMNFRGELLEELQARGHCVKVAAPVGKDLDGASVSSQDVIPIRVDRMGINLKNDLRLFWDLVRVLSSEKPDIVLNYTIKPVIYGSLAAGLFSQAKIFSNITGLGYVFTDISLKARVLRALVTFLYKISLGFNEKVFFQNPDDVQLFLKLKILSEDKIKQLNGSGINLDKFKTLETHEKKPQSFLFVGRLLKDKGLIELIQAFNLVRLKYPEAILTVVGEEDSNPNSFSQKQIESLQKAQNGIHFTGRMNDIRSLLQSHQVMVLPSYREGTPRSVLEAMAAGMPIITTDAPGCRETVIEGKSGFLVPVKDSEILAEKMIYFIENPDEIQKMGKAGLNFAREKFDVNKVNMQILETLGIK